MADMVKIVLEERNEKGKQAVKKLRPTGYVPAVFYGPEYRDAVTVKVKASDIAAVIRSGHWETVRFNASLPNGREEMCLMRNIQRSLLNNEIIHIDFIQLLKGHKIAVNIPVVLEGREDCVGLKHGGIIEQLLYEVEIEVLPTEIPNSVSIDVSGLNVGEGFSVKDLALPKSADILVDLEELVVTVAQPKAEVEEEEEEVEAGEVEVVAKGKAKEEEE